MLEKSRITEALSYQASNQLVYEELKQITTLLITLMLFENCFWASLIYYFLGSMIGLLMLVF